MREDEFERLLKIARLRLKESEKERIKGEIEEVVRYFDKIDRFDAREEPSYQPIRVPTRFRKDRVEAFKDVELLKKGSMMHGDYIVGPKL